jgi:hypothetical protein
MRDIAIAILVLAICAVACDDRPQANPGPPSDLRPISIRIDGPTQVTPGVEVRFTALQTWSDGSTRDVTASALWTSTNPSVLLVNAGFAYAPEAGGEVGLTAHVAPLTSQRKSVRVVPLTPEWDGTYTLTIGGGACSSSLPLPPELRQRTFTAIVRQISLRLEGEIRNVGNFGGQILNPQVRFFFSSALPFSRRAEQASAMETSTVGTRLASLRKSAYWGPTNGLVEVLADSNRLVITGEAITTMSPSGFAGTFSGNLSLYEPSRNGLLGVCSSFSHGFALVRQ